MLSFLKKHWLYLLGALFIGMGLAYLLKYAIEINILSNYLKLSICLTSSLIMLISGFILSKKFSSPYPELSIALGTIMFNISVYLGVSAFKVFGNTLFALISTTSLIIILVFSTKFNFRILSSISFISYGLSVLSILSVPTSAIQIPLISLMLIISSIAFFKISHIKNWFELKLIAFIGTWFIFYSITPLNTTETANSQFIFSYTLLFLSFTIALMVSMASNTKIKLTEYILFLYNAFLFLKPISNMVPYAPLKIIILISVGITYIICAIIINYIWGRAAWKYYLLSFLLGIFLIVNSITLMEFGQEYNSLVSVFVWIFIISILLILRKFLLAGTLKILTLTLWFATIIFWGFANSHVPTFNLFNKFIPFVNPSSIAWVLLATIGFIISSRISLSLFNDSSNTFLPSLIKILSNLLILRLVAIELGNIWSNYQIPFAHSSIMFTLFLGVYSIALLLKSLYSRNLIYRNFSLTVLILVTFKCLFYDLKTSQTLYKVVFLMALGLITIIIASLNKKLTAQETLDNEKY